MRNEKHHKGWNEIKTNDSWAIFKIMGEFVNGFEKMSKIGPCVSIFGSARTAPDHKYYKLAQSIAKSIVEAGYGVITGGGPGIMEAGNKGAHIGGGTSDTRRTIRSHYTYTNQQNRKVSYNTCW